VRAPHCRTRAAVCGCRLTVSRSRCIRNSVQTRATAQTVLAQRGGWGESQEGRSAGDLGMGDRDLWVLLAMVARGSRRCARNAR
jgi:hypothetical protein